MHRETANRIPITRIVKGNHKNGTATVCGYNNLKEYITHCFPFNITSEFLEESEDYQRGAILDTWASLDQLSCEEITEFRTVDFSLWIPVDRKDGSK